MKLPAMSVGCHWVFVLLYCSTWPFVGAVFETAVPCRAAAVPALVAVVAVPAVAALAALPLMFMPYVPLRLAEGTEPVRFAAFSGEAAVSLLARSLVRFVAWLSVMLPVKVPALTLVNPEPSPLNLLPVTVRRERRWTSAGASPARELVRSTR